MYIQLDDLFLINVTVYSGSATLTSAQDLFPSASSAKKSQS